jgi:glucose 1-dehydrogenase
MMMSSRRLRLSFVYVASQWWLILTALVCMTTPHSTLAYSLQGKRALVTGSSGGIGRGIALELARQGCHVLVHYHTRHAMALETQALIQVEGGTCAGVIQCDFRQTSHIYSMMQQIDVLWPDGWDILVNNAGVVTKLALEDDDYSTPSTSSNTLLWDGSSSSAWHDTMAVNLHAPVLLSTLAVPRMQMHNDSGVILHVSSIHGTRSNEYMGAYAASKAALESVTRTMAMEWAAYNIRVNAIAPGVVPVERTAEAFAHPPTMHAWTERIPLQQVGTVEYIAQAALPLLTNDWITGTIWTVDGGMMARSNMPVRERPLKAGGTC